jgi:hypothetical protein
MREFFDFLFTGLGAVVFTLFIGCLVSMVFSDIFKRFKKTHTGLYLMNIVNHKLGSKNL